MDKDAFLAKETLDQTLGVRYLKAAKDEAGAVGESVRLVSTHFPDVAVITGAGIESGEDVEAALRLGTKGVLLASAAVKTKDHYQKIMELAKPLTTA